jgi:hypothetical protein
VATVENSTAASTWHMSEGDRIAKIVRYRTRNGQRLQQDVLDSDSPSLTFRRRGAISALNRYRWDYG